MIFVETMTKVKTTGFLLLLSGLILTTTVQLSAQKDGIERGGYRLMLKSLLSHTVPEITVKEAYDQKEEVLFLDAREPEEWQISHIDDAMFVGYDQFDMTILEATDKDQPIVVYCSVGYRSEKVSELLLADGFTNVQNLYGGIFEWKNQDFPVVDEQEEETERVHAFDRTWGVWLREGEKVYR